MLLREVSFEALVLDEGGDVLPGRPVQAVQGGQAASLRVAARQQNVCKNHELCENCPQPNLLDRVKTSSRLIVNDFKDIMNLGETITHPLKDFVKAKTSFRCYF